MQLRQAIQEVQKIGQDYGFTIIIVGGSMVRLIGKKTVISKVDIDKRTIYLDHAENVSTRRPEDPTTIVDIDCIAFADSNPFAKETHNAFDDLQKALYVMQKQPDFPAVSLEPVLYHPYFSKPNTLMQFVSSIESYHDHDYFFRLGSVKKDVQQKSLAFWTYDLGDNQQIMSFSPLAIQLRYEIRGFSPKPKDREKIFSRGAVFAQFVEMFNKKTHDKLINSYSEWHDFANSVNNSYDLSMQVKKTLWKLYWLTIGTYLAHGTGLIGKLLLPLGNTFFAGK